jgi:alpha-tubulin suppressor-like RCC1 family protein
MPDCTGKACAEDDGCGGSCADTCGASAVAAGWAHTCAIANAGVQCWGDNSAGELGTGNTKRSNVPVNVVGLSSGVTAIAAGNNFTCAIVNGGVSCWGTSEFGQLGHGSATGSLVPVPVQGLSSGVSAISAGYAHACAIVPGQGVACWGKNDDGQLGNGLTKDSYTPTFVSRLSADRALAVAAGSDATCARLASNRVSCWGKNSNGQLGDGLFATSAFPVTASVASASAIAAGGSFACAITPNGALCWGNGGLGQLGSTTSYTPNPTDVIGLPRGVSAIATGNAHTCAILVDGGLLCWGDNTSGDLGNGSTAESSAAMPVQGLASGVVAVSGGGAHTCAIANMGQVLCWGQNSAGQLGNGSMADSAVPVTVVGF